MASHHFLGTITPNYYNMKKRTTCILFFILIGITTQSQPWKQLGQDIDAEAAHDRFGHSVSISSDGETIAIGAFTNKGNGTNAGHVRVFKLISGVWTQLGSDIDGEEAGDNSGWSVSLNSDGSTVAIGARQNDGNGIVSGHVRIYKLISGVWTQQGGDIDGEAEGDKSGYSVSISSDGSIVAIGAPENDGIGSNSGHVRIYKLISGVWTQQGGDIDGESEADDSGSSVSINSDGSIVAIGAPHNDGVNGYESGHVRVYKLISGIWTQEGGDIDGEAADDLSGSSVSINSDGSIVAIGAPRNADNGSFAGHVRVYKLISGVWTQQGLDIDGEAAGDNSGCSVSLNSDGSIVAIGAFTNAGNGAAAGHVRVYKLISGVWIQQGQDIDGEAAWDGSGISVSLNSDGSTLIIGAQENTGNGSYAGHARVHHICYASTSKLSVTRCNSYTVPSGDETYLISGIYTDTISNYIGCDSLITVDLTINTVNVTIANNSPVLIANATDAKYQWLDCDNGYSVISGDTNESFTAKVNGNYAVEIIQKNCVDTSVCIAVHNAHVLENDFGNALKIYPNPTYENLYIELDDYYSEVSVIVRTQLGQIVGNRHFSSNKIEVSIEGEPGVYYVEIRTKNGNDAHFMIVKK